MQTLSSHQQDAVSKIRGWYQDLPNFYGSREAAFSSAPVFDLSGYAGTGKSTILPHIIQQLGLDPTTDVAFCAPTGKASKVMAEKLADASIYSGARTIHSLIYRPKAMKAEQIEKNIAELQALHAITDTAAGKLDIEKSIKIMHKDLERAYDESAPRFTLNSESDIKNKKLVVCDEASMVGETIADDLRAFGVPILAMGDPGQLPPIGEARGLQKDRADFFLTEVHRQAEGNPIIRLATLARRGELLPYGDYGDGVQVVSYRDDKATLDMERDAQIICGTHRTRWKLTRRIRKAMDYNSTGPMAGEPLIICKNSRNVGALVNGTFVLCETDVGELETGEPYVPVTLRDEKNSIHVIQAYQGLLEEHFLKEKNGSTCSKSAAFRARISGEHVDWGWAITCHKSQGSQWDEVVVHDESGVFRDDASKWLYTAITRAAKRLTVVV